MLGINPHMQEEILDKNSVRIIRGFAAQAWLSGHLLLREGQQGEKNFAPKFIQAGWEEVKKGDPADTISLSFQRKNFHTAFLLKSEK